MHNVHPSPKAIAVIPNRHKLAILTWFIVYPLITVLLFFSEPLMTGWPVPVKTFVLTLVMVPVIVYVAMPFATRILHDWLHDDAPGRTSDG